LLGTWKFLVVYFGGGILGGIVYLLLPPSPMAVAVGASGAIFALGGTLAVMRPRLRVIVFPIPIPLPLWIAIIGIFAIFSFLPNVAWQAHLGGLLLGLVVGYLFRRRERYFYY
jgi:membrane associated rhomboid family serine protease